MELVLPGAGAAAGASAGAGTGAGTLVDPIVIPGQPDGGGSNQQEKCRRMQEKIDNLKKEIYDKRIPDLEANPNGLPQRIGPGEGLWQTIRGHGILLTIKLYQLKKLENQFEQECSCFMALQKALPLNEIDQEVLFALRAISILQVDQLGFWISYGTQSYASGAGRRETNLNYPA